MGHRGEDGPHCPGPHGGESPPRSAGVHGEEALGHHALVAGFQGQRQWTDHFPNGDFMEAMLCSSFDWNGIRQPYMLATENDALNGVSMLFGHLLTGPHRCSAMYALTGAPGP
ncbi:MAG: hypothetical protein R2751_17215 [Bacteroidales bacterium]